jgi:hypothetical protein
MDVVMSCECNNHSWDANPPWLASQLRNSLICSLADNAHPSAYYNTVTPICNWHTLQALSKALNACHHPAGPSLSSECLHLFESCCPR